MYAQLLIAASLVAASVQDVRSREVDDIVWIPAVVGAAYSLWAVYPETGLIVLKMALLGGLSLAFMFYGSMGQADVIAMVLIGADPDVTSILPIFVATGIAALAHIAYEYGRGNTRRGKQVPLERFLTEKCWIPKAIIFGGERVEVSGDVNVAREEVAGRAQPGSMVEVAYGVPEVAYLGVGYAAFLLALLLAGGSLFFSLP